MQTLFHLALHPYVMHANALWCVKRDSPSYLASTRQKREQEANFLVTKNAQSCTDTLSFQNHRQLLRRNCSPCTSPQKPGNTNKMHNTIIKHHFCSLSSSPPDVWIRDARVDQAPAVRQLSDVSFIGNISDPLLDADALSRAGILLKDGARASDKGTRIQPWTNPGVYTKEEGVLVFEGFGIFVWQIV